MDCAGRGGQRRRVAGKTLPDLEPSALSNEIRGEIRGEGRAAAALLQSRPQPERVVGNDDDCGGRREAVGKAAAVARRRHGSNQEQASRDWRRRTALSIQY